MLPSFLEISALIPDSKGEKLFFGMGGGNIKQCGQIQCKITFREFIVVPDEQSVLPLIIARDLLNKLNVGLGQLKIRYSSC